MAYNFYPSNQPMAIAEQQYATATEVRFTTFDSCIGVLGYAQNGVTGVHLVVFSKDGTSFNTNAADKIINDIMPGKNRYVLIGDVENWQNPRAVGEEAAKGTQRLIERLKPYKEQHEQGIFGGRVYNGQYQMWVQPQGQTGQYKNVPA